MRGINFFSPQRKALRDSAHRARLDQLVAARQARRSAQLSQAPQVMPCGEEESLRKNPRLRRLISRPTAILPRSHFLFIKSGSVPLSVEDLSVPAKSIFAERGPTGALPGGLPLNGGKLKPVTWQALPGTAEKPLLAVEKTDVCVMAKQVLGESPLVSTASQSLTASGTNLMAVLREKAVVYGQTGIDPDLLAAVRAATTSGIERLQRNEELRKCDWTVERLITENRASVENFNFLIRALMSRHKWDEAVAVERSMAGLGFPPDAETYVSLMAGADAGRARSAFLAMRAQLIAPTEKVFGALITAHVRSKDLAAAFALLQKMEDELGVPSSPVVYTSLLGGLVKAGKLDVAWDRFRSWRTWRAVKPDAVMFSVMIRACTARAECERALGLMDDLRASHELPTDVTYAHLIECLAMRADFAPKAFETFQQMQLEGFEMNGMVAGSLLRACAQQGDVDRLRRTVKQIADRGIPLTAKMYSDAIGTIAASLSDSSTGHDRGVSVRLAWHVVADLRAKNVAVTTEILNAVMQVYVAAGNVEQAASMLEQFSAFNSAPTAATYEILLSAYAKTDVGKFFALFEHCATTVGQGLREGVFHEALDVAMETRSSRRVVAVLEAMLARGFRPVPAAAAKLAVVGRQVAQIHQVVGRMVAQQRQETHERAEQEASLLALEIEEHRTRIAQSHGLTDLAFTTPENEARARFWGAAKKATPRLARKEYLEVKKRGGPMHALRKDKPRPNLVP